MIHSSLMQEEFRYIYRKIIWILTLLTQTRVIMWKLQALYYCLLVPASRGERFVTWTFGRQLQNTSFPQKYSESASIFNFNPSFPIARTAKDTHRLRKQCHP